MWKGALLAFLADNLAAHELGGFKESFSFAYRLYGKKRGLSGSFPFTLREPVSHAYHCSVLDGPDSNKSSVEYGVNRLSLLDSLPYFSGMPHDIMHDLFEGVIPYELKLLIDYCSITQSLNHPFDCEIGDKPAPIRESKL